MTQHFTEDEFIRLSSDLVELKAAKYETENALKKIRAEHDKTLKQLAEAQKQIVKLDASITKSKERKAFLDLQTELDETREQTALQQKALSGQLRELYDENNKLKQQITNLQHQAASQSQIPSTAAHPAVEAFPVDFGPAPHGAISSSSSTASSFFTHDAELERLRQANADLDSRCAALFSDNASMALNHKNEVENLLASLRKDRDELSRLRNEVEEWRRKGDVTAELASAKEEVKRLSHQMVGKKKELDTVSARLEESERERRRLQRELSASTSPDAVESPRASPTSASVSQLPARSPSMLASAAELTEAKAETEQLRRQVQSLRSELEEAQEQVAQLRESEAARRAKMDSEIANLVRALGTVQSECQDAQARLQVATREADESGRRVKERENECRRIATERDDARSAAEKNKQEFATELQRVSSAAEALRKERDDLLREIVSLGQDRTSIVHERDTLYRENGVLTKEVENVTRQRDTSTAERDHARKETSSLSADVEMLSKEKAGLQQQRDSLTLQKSSLSQEKDTLTREKDTLTREKDTLTREKDTLTREKDTLTREKDTLTREKETALRDKEKLLKEKENVTKERDAVSKDRDNLTREKDNLLKERDAMAKEKSQLTTSLSTSAADATRLSQELHAAQSQLTEYRSQAALLNKQLATEQDNSKEIASRLYQLQESAEERIAGLAAEAANLDLSLTDCRQTISDLLSDKQSLAQDLAGTREELSSVSARLEATQNSLRETRSQLEDTLSALCKTQQDLETSIALSASLQISLNEMRLQKLLCEAQNEAVSEYACSMAARLVLRRCEVAHAIEDLAETRQALLDCQTQFTDLDNRMKVSERKHLNLVRDLKNQLQREALKNSSSMASPKVASLIGKSGASTYGSSSAGGTAGAPPSPSRTLFGGSGGGSVSATPSRTQSLESSTGVLGMDDIAGASVDEYLVVLSQKVADLQTQNFRYEEKIRVLEDSLLVLKEELEKKKLIIERNILQRQPMGVISIPTEGMGPSHSSGSAASSSGMAGSRTPSSSASHAQYNSSGHGGSSGAKSKIFGIFGLGSGSSSSAHASDGNQLPRDGGQGFATPGKKGANNLSKEVRDRTMDVLEEALIKNIQLQNDVKTLGDEVARLMKENALLRSEAPS